MISQTASVLAPEQLRLEFAVLSRYNHLSVLAIDCVSVGQHPATSSPRFVVVELALEVAAVGVGPATRHEAVLNPVAYVLHAGGTENVGPLSVLFAVRPLSRVDVLVGVDKHALALLLALVPLSVVLALVAVN